MVSTPTAVTPAVASTDGELYRPWLRLRLSHGHLASAQSVGRQLALMPDRVTLKALERLEMVAIQEPDGCTLLLKDRLRPLLARWLEADGGGRLQWRLVARQGSIWGCTAVPLAARCRRWHLYGSAASGQCGGALAVRLLEVVEAELVLSPPPGSGPLRLLDERGQLLQELPLTALAAAQPLVVPLSSLPEGLIRASVGVGAALDPILHLPFVPDAIGLVSLQLPASAALAGPLEFGWSLPGRQTVWHYLLVPAQAGDVLTGLRIQGDGCAFAAASAPETLGDGRQAWRLVGQQALPLLERCPLRFRLEGERQGLDGQSQRLVIDPLPVPSAEPIWPGDSPESLVGVSELVVVV
jgi:hypothetical protein